VRRLLLRNLLGAGNVFLILACGGRLCLFLRRRLARGFRRFVTHKHNAKVHGNRRQLSGRERSQWAPAPVARLSGNNTRGHSRAIREQPMVAVTFFLSAGAVGNTLDFVVRHAGLDSSIAFDYVTEQVIDGSFEDASLKAVLRMMHQVGEPWIFGLPAAGFEAFLRTFGLDVICDLDGPPRGEAADFHTRRFALQRERAQDRKHYTDSHGYTGSTSPPSPCWACASARASVGFNTSASTGSIPTATTVRLHLWSAVKKVISLFRRNLALYRLFQ
jgi:hypothetical protein